MRITDHHLGIRMRRRSRWAILTALILAGSTLLGTTVRPAPATAATGTWEINNWRHFCGLGQESGSDEFYLVNIWFRFQPGWADSVQVGRTAIYEIDDIDDEEYHSVPADMGQARFSNLRNFGLNAWTAGEIFSNRGPEIVGTITQVMEADTTDNPDRRKVVDGLVSGLRTELRAVASVTGPITVMGTTASFALGDALAGQNMNADRQNLLRSYVTGAATNVAISTVRKAGFWSTLKTLKDDWIGSPRLSVFISTDNFVASLIDPTLAQQSTGGHMFGSMRSRDWKVQYKGDGARYVMDVRTRPA